MYWEPPNWLTTVALALVIGLVGWLGWRYLDDRPQKPPPGVRPMVAPGSPGMGAGPTIDAPAAPPVTTP